MKKAIALILVVTMFVFILAACEDTGELSGKYVAELLGEEISSYEFDGDKVTYSLFEVEMYSGTYKIEDGKIIFTEADEYSYVDEFSFKRSGNKVTINDVEHVKK